MIVVLRALGVGDLATAVPALRGLRNAYPDRTIELAAPAWLAPLARLTGAVDRLVPVDGLGAHRWGPAGVELAVNLHGRGPESHRLLAAARPGRMYAFANAAAGHLDGPDWMFEEHEVARWCRLLDWYGIPTDPADLDLLPPARVRYGRTIVHPGAKSPIRRWPVDRYATVARELSAAGHQVVVTGAAEERATALAVARVAGLPADAVLAGRTDLAGLAGLVAGARLVISGDTGIAHLATAYRTPSVVLFGPVPPRLWGPPADRPYHRALWHGHTADPGDSASPDPHPALLQITPDEVLGATRQICHATADV